MSLRNLALAAAVAIAVLPAHAGAIHVQWDSVTGATGYRVYFGSEQGQYNQSRDVGNTNSAVVDGLPDCSPSFLAIKAYNPAGESRTFSNEITGWPRPEVGAASPLAEIQGTQFTLDLSGSNFQPGARLEIDNPDVFLDSPAVVSCNQIQVAATVEPNAEGVRPAEIGRFKLTVVNPDDVFGERAGAFEVRVNPSRFDIDHRPGPSQGRIDGRDTIWLSRLFGSQEGDASYFPDSDFNGDGWVDGQDLVHVASNLGRCWNGAAWTADSCQP
jgi:hypothetical protein